MSKNVAYMSLPAELRQRIILDALISFYHERVGADTLRRIPWKCKLLWLGDLRLTCWLFEEDLQKIIKRYKSFLIKSCATLCSEIRIAEIMAVFVGDTFRPSEKDFTFSAEQWDDRADYLWEQMKYGLSEKWAVGFLIVQKDRPVDVRHKAPTSAQMESMKYVRYDDQMNYFEYSIPGLATDAWIERLHPDNVDESRLTELAAREAVHSHMNKNMSLDEECSRRWDEVRAMRDEIQRRYPFCAGSSFPHWPPNLCKRFTMPGLGLGS